jgi:hypothetical protein
VAVAATAGLVDRPSVRKHKATAGNANFMTHESFTG